MTTTLDTTSTHVDCFSGASFGEGLQDNGATPQLLIPQQQESPLNCTIDRRTLKVIDEEKKPFITPISKITWAKINFALNLFVAGCSITAIVLYASSGNAGAIAAMSGALAMSVGMGYGNLQRMHGADI